MYASIFGTIVWAAFSARKDAGTKNEQDNPDSPTANLAKRSV